MARIDQLHSRTAFHARAKAAHGRERRWRPAQRQVLHQLRRQPTTVRRAWLLFSWISPPLGSPIWRYGLIVAAPQTGVVIADTHSNLLLAGTSHFLWPADHPRVHGTSPQLVLTFLKVEVAVVDDR
jgi:hypothetical protein